jgi:hypothetical protein
MARQPPISTRGPLAEAMQAHLQAGQVSKWPLALKHVLHRRLALPPLQEDITAGGIAGRAAGCLIMGLASCLWELFDASRTSSETFLSELYMICRAAAVPCTRPGAAAHAEQQPLCPAAAPPSKRPQTPLGAMQPQDDPCLSVRDRAGSKMLNHPFR